MPARTSPREVILLLDRVFNPDDPRRDIVYDELNDLACGRILDEAQQTMVAKSTLARLPDERDLVVLESMFNLLSTVFDNGVAKDEIADGIAPALASLPVGALMHAIPIIAASARADRAALLSPFQTSANPAIRETMAYAADDLARKTL